MFLKLKCYGNMLIKACTDPIWVKNRLVKWCQCPSPTFSHVHARRNQIVFLLCDYTESAAKSNYSHIIIVAAVAWIPIQNLSALHPIFSSPFTDVWDWSLSTPSSRTRALDGFFYWVHIENVHSSTERKAIVICYSKMSDRVKESFMTTSTPHLDKHQ